jgi:branched-chain amino acid transport system permease protein
VTLEFWAQQLVNGLTTGVVYALMGMGFSMVWATARTMNFAYGVTFTLGAYVLAVTFTAFSGGDLSLPLLVAAFAVVALVGGALGYALDRGVFRPLRDNETAPFFASLGVAIALENVYGFVFGVHPLVLNVAGAREFLQIGPVTVTPTQLVVLGASISIMLGLHHLFNRTAEGRAMRAAAWDRNTARLMGINVNRVIALVFVVSSLIAASAGAFVAVFYGVVTPYMGSAVLVKGLAAAILGGFGNIPGAIVGGLLLGVLDASGAGLVTAGNWQDVVAYAVLIFVILVRPQGIFGERGVTT